VARGGRHRAASRGKGNVTEKVWGGRKVNSLFLKTDGKRRERSAKGINAESCKFPKVHGGGPEGRNLGTPPTTYFGKKKKRGQRYGFVFKSPYTLL